jgi:hypothetical protein
MKPGMTRWKDDPANPNPFSPVNMMMMIRIIIGIQMSRVCERMIE